MRLFHRYTETSVAHKTFHCQVLLKKGVKRLVRFRAWNGEESKGWNFANLVSRKHNLQDSIKNYHHKTRKWHFRPILCLIRTFQRASKTKKKEIRFQKKAEIRWKKEEFSQKAEHFKPWRLTWLTLAIEKVYWIFFLQALGQRFDSRTCRFFSYNPLR